jgi:hypothetical protein
VNADDSSNSDDQDEDPNPLTSRHNRMTHPLQLVFESSVSDESDDEDRTSRRAINKPRRRNGADHQKEKRRVKRERDRRRKLDRQPFASAMQIRFDEIQTIYPIFAIADTT